MKNFLNSIHYIPKYVALFMALTFASATTFMSVAQSIDTYIQGDITVKNVTSGSTTYTESTTAVSQDVVRFKVNYYNTELASSGKVARNMTVVIDFPSALASTQNVGATIRGDNTNTIYDSATVHLGGDTYRLEYIPGSAKWQRNIGDRQNINYQFISLNDNVVTEGAPVVLGDIEPSYEFEGFVYFDARIVEEQKPVYMCESLTAVVNPANRFAFTFTAKTNVSGGASVNKYIYNFGVTGESPVNTDKAQITKIYSEPGTYNASVEVVFNVGEVQKSDVCKTTVTIEPEEPPVTPPVTPPAPELPQTGPASIIAGIFGTGALSYGVMSLRASRSSLRDKILGLE